MKIICSYSRCSNQATNLALFLSQQGQFRELGFCKEHAGSLPLDYFVPDPRRLHPDVTGSSNEECYLHAIFWNYEPEQFTVVLKSRESGLVFVVQTGYIEATLIQGYAKKLPCSSRLTHELILDIIQGLDASVMEVCLYGYDKTVDTYKCYVAIDNGDRVIRANCRISDAVALSLCANVPVRVNKAFLGKDLST